VGVETVTIPGAIEVAYTDPFEESTPRKSQSWYDLRTLYLSFKVVLNMSHEEVPLDIIRRNENDGGKWRWDTPLFDKEVDGLIESIRSTKKFEAVWLKKQDGIYTLLDGHHRLAAWQRMGNSAIPAVVVTVTPRKSEFQFK
jgi:ParB-like nuclease domain